MNIDELLAIVNQVNSTNPKDRQKVLLETLNELQSAARQEKDLSYSVVKFRWLTFSIQDRNEIIRSSGMNKQSTRPGGPSLQYQRLSNESRDLIHRFDHEYIQKSILEIEKDDTAENAIKVYESFRHDLLIELFNQCLLNSVISCIQKNIENRNQTGQNLSVNDIISAAKKQYTQALYKEVFFQFEQICLIERLETLQEKLTQCIREEAGADRAEKKRRIEDNISTINEQMARYFNQYPQLETIEGFWLTEGTDDFTGLLNDPNQQTNAFITRNLAEIISPNFGEKTPLNDNTVRTYCVNQPTKLVDYMVHVAQLINQPIEQTTAKVREEESRLQHEIGNQLEKEKQAKSQLAEQQQFLQNIIDHLDKKSPFKSYGKRILQLLQKIEKSKLLTTQSRNDYCDGLRLVSDCILNTLDEAILRNILTTNETQIRAILNKTPAQKIQIANECTTAGAKIAQEFKTSSGRKWGGLAAIIAGTAIILASVAFAVATHGFGAPLSIAGIDLGAALITGALIAAGAVTAGIGTGFFATRKPLEKRLEQTIENLAASTIDSVTDNDSNPHSPAPTE